MLAGLNVEMNAELTAAEPRGRIGEEADEMLSGSVRGERESSLGRVQLGKNNLNLQFSLFSIRKSLPCHRDLELQHAFQCSGILRSSLY